MNCLERYRNRLVREVNRDLRTIRELADEEAIHDFRVGVKRLTALYYFLAEIDPELRVRRTLKPARRIFKLVGITRDAQIALQLVDSLDELAPADAAALSRALQARIRSDYRAFRARLADWPSGPLRLPTIRATGISEAAILRHKPVSLAALLREVFVLEGRITSEQWHKKRILLKRYRHKLDAFAFCPGHLQDEAELKQIRLLEQLLGDWHDRVTTIELLRALHEPASESAIRILGRQQNALLGAARIYLRKYRDWHAAR
ncbi:MAG: CHAD domain-containing protein [Gammaproteobacteria bacterium]|nr:CHAD domain-containing protein [Gammaproteobacteria bacterium]